MELDTSKAVDTELGRLYLGMTPSNTRGLRADEVRKRIVRWKVAVVRVQRRTNFEYVLVSDLRDRGWGHTKEQILINNRPLRQSAKVAIFADLAQW